jgi:NAD(P)-dependent dehydrogenase (short-subunit alcohol dehydrogenase family)
MPGPFPTHTAPLGDQHRFERLSRPFPLRRGGAPSELAGAALYLASDAASFTTGAVIPVDGGMQWSMADTGEAAHD